MDNLESNKPQNQTLVAVPGQDIFFKFDDYLQLPGANKTPSVSGISPYLSADLKPVEVAKLDSNLIFYFDISGFPDSGGRSQPENRVQYPQLLSFKGDPLIGLSTGVLTNFADSLINLGGGTFANTSSLTPTSESVDTSLPQALSMKSEKLAIFAESSDFGEKMKQAFGNGFSVEQAQTLVRNLASGAVLPEIEIVPVSELGAKGGFAASTNRIYLAREFNDENADKPEVIANVLLEEIGHYIDAQLNESDSVGDEGAIFAALVTGRELESGEFFALKAEDDTAIVTLSGQPTFIEQSSLFTSGVFTVGVAGDVGVDFVLDGGSYVGELAIFSLQGMEQFTPGSEAFIKEAARRALTTSQLGYVVISDPTEGAKFSGILPGESGDFNAGTYKGIKTFNMRPGDTFGVMLVPNGRVQQVFDNPAATGGLRPFFSLATANPDNGLQAKQIADVVGNGHTFAMEDWPLNNSPYKDYNDVIFQLTGANGSTPLLNDVINPALEWRNTSLGQQILEYAQRVRTANVTLAEGNNFNKTYLHQFKVPSGLSFLTFNFSDLNFDTTDTVSINDAFEVALLDASGRSLVHTIGTGGDSFFNLTEGEPVQLGAGTTYDAAKKTVTLNLSGIASGTEGTVVFRLVNDDKDTTSSVKIGEIALISVSANTPTPVQTDFTATSTPTPIATTDFSRLVDVSPSVQADYKSTTFNANTKELYADFSVRNAGGYSVDAPIAVAVTRISNPSVLLRNPDGLTPEGIPYYNFSNLVADGKLDPNEASNTRSLVFYNPLGVQFTYDLVVLGQLNQSPVIQTQANSEIIGGQSYRYDVEATDPNGDTLTYKLLSSPNGMQINSTSGLISWDTVASNKGNHAVLVEVSDGRGGVSTQSYSLSVIDAPPNRPPVFTSNPVVDAAINTPYRYDADARDPDSDALTYSLGYGPEGMTVNPVTGEVRWTPPSVMVFGDTVLGRISNPGEQDAFTFSGIEGQRIYFDSLIGNSTQLLKLYSPSGLLALDKDTTYSGSINLTETGNYRLVIDGKDSATGDYGFSLLDLEAIPIASFDKNINGVLTPGSEDDLYRFNGNAGQRLYFDKLSNETNLDWVVYGADNQIITSGGWNDLEVVLPADGQYILALQGKANFSSSVAYTFRIVTPDTITSALTLGSNATPNAISTAITEKGEQDVYTFTGTTGQRLYFDVINNGGYYTHSASLKSASGEEYFSRSLSAGDLSPFTLKESGTYRLVVDGNGENTGNYSFSLMDVGAATSIALDTDISGQLNPGQETHFYKLSGTTGQQLYMDSLMSASNVNWRLYDSGNKDIGNSSMSSDWEVTLPNTDSYTLAIQGSNSSPVDYKFRLITPDTITSALTLGSNATPNAISTAITEKGEQDVYTFTGTTGQRLYFDVINNGGSSTHSASLKSASGEEYFNRYLSSGDLSPFTLKESGTYRLVVDGNGENTGNYSFRMADLGLASSLTLGAPLSGSLSANQVQLYTFNGTQGQRLKFDSLLAASGADWVLYGAGNSVVGSSSLGSDFERVLPSTDNYILALRNNSSSAVNFNIRVDNITPPSVSQSGFGTVYAGTSTATPTNQTLSATAGTYIYFDSQIAYNSYHPVTAKLLDPLGNQVFSTNASTDAGIYQLQQTGNYTLQVVGSSSYRHQIIDLGTATNLSLNTVTNVSLNPNYAATVYKFTGTVGQQLFYDALNSNNPNVSLKLLSPSGRELFNNIGAQSDIGVDGGLTLIESGTYYLVFSNSQGAATNVSFRLLDKASATLINLDTDVTGTLANGGIESDLYRFTGTAGQYLYLDAQAGLEPNGWILYSPNGQQLKTGSVQDGYQYYSYQDDYEFTAPATGEYLLVMQGKGATNTNYKFHIVTPPLTEQSLSLNTTVSSSIGERGEKDNYTFTGASGQRLFFDRITGVSDIKAKLYSPSGSLVMDGNTGSDFAPFFLRETGEYRLEIDGNKNTTGNYSFRLVDVENVPTLTLDTAIPGTLNPGTEVDFYQFLPAVGQPLYFDLTASSWSNANWVLYGPDNKALATPNASSPDFELSPTIAGTYILAVSGDSGSSVGYNFKVVTPTTTTNTLALGNAVSGTLSEAGEKDEYSFTGTVGQRLFFDALSGSSSIRGRLISPTGVTVVDQAINGDWTPLTLTEAGTYRLVIDGDNNTTGSYSFRLSDIAATTALQVGTAISGSLNPGNEVDLYQFNGTVGQKLKFDLAAASWSGADWVLYNTNNQAIATSSADFDKLLPATGLYALAIRGSSASPVNYSFTVTNQTPTSVATTGLGTVQSGTIAAGQVRTQTFTASSGTRIYFDSQDVDNDPVKVTILNPDGTQVFSTNASDDKNETQLQQTGTYTVRVEGNTSTSTGDYRYRIVELPSLAPDPRSNENSLQLGTIVTKTLDFGRATEVYSFAGKVGQRIFYDGMNPASGTTKVRSRLLSPTGNQVFNLDPYYGGSVQNFGLYTLTEEGTYNLLMVGEQDAPVNFRFQMLDLANAQELEMNKRINGNLQPGSATNLYKFTGTALQRLYFDSISGSGANWALYRPGNEKVQSDIGITNDFEVVLPVDGEYVLAVLGNGATASNYSFSAISAKPSTAIVTPGDGETSGADGGELGTYRVRVDATDGRGGKAEQGFQIRVTPEPGNHAPLIITEGVKTGYDTKRYIYDVDATDADGDSLTYFLTDAPSGMIINSETGKITWATPVAGIHKVKVRVEDGRGGRETQAFDLSISDIVPGTIKGTVFLDIDGNGKRRVTNPGNMIPDNRVVVGDLFKDNYAAYDLGRPDGVPGILGAMTFKRNANGVVDPNTLLLGGGAASGGGALYEVKVLRSEGGHIIGFDDDADAETPYGASYFADSPYSDAGLVYTKDNVLLANMWSPSGLHFINPGGAPNLTLPNGFGGLTFVPEGLPGAGQLKATGKWPSNAFLSVNYSSDGTFANGTRRYKIDSVEYETNVGAGPGAFVYMNTSAPNFETGPGLLMADWNLGQVNAYELDGDGNPISATKKLFIDKYHGAWGGTYDPVTGDLLFNGWLGYNNLMIVRGLGQPGANEPGINNWLVYVDADKDGIRDIGEEFTYTDAQGNYRFTLAPGTHRIVQETPTGWTQTSPSNPKYQEVTLVSNETKFGVDFGNTNSQINGENIAPEITSNPPTPLEVIATEKYLYRVTATDLNNDNLTFELVNSPSGMAIAPNGIISWRPTNSQIGTHNIIVRVSDGKGGIDLQNFDLAVKQSNLAPIFTSIAPEIARPQVGKTFQYQAKAIDLDGDTITYQIIPNTTKPVTPNSAQIDSTTGLITWTPTNPGGAFQWIYANDIEPWQILIKATDNKGGEAYQQLNLIVDPATANRAPTITSTPRTSTKLGNTYFYKIEATDPDGDPLTYTLNSAPTGMTIDKGNISWTPNPNQFGNNNITVKVSDNQGGSSTQTFNINVTNIPINRAPTITSTPNTVTNLEKEYQYNLTGNDPDGDPLFWTLETAPTGMVIDPEKGTLRWQPQSHQIGNQPIAIRLMDSYGAYSTQEFSLTVTGVNNPPSIISTPSTNATTSKPYNYQVIATDSDNDPLTYSLGTAPKGMTIDSKGKITWTPASNQTGNPKIEVFVTDNQGAISRQTYNIEVVNTPINQAPIITSTPTFKANTSQTYNYQITATDPDNNPLTYQLLSAPTGMTINSTSGNLTWTNPLSGNPQIVVGVVDSLGLSAAQGFTLTTRTNSIPIINSTPTTTATPNTPYTYDIKATDSDNDTLTYTLDQNSLNKGITVDSLGRIRWTPTTNNIGIQPITITVNDNNGGITQQQYNLSVAADTIAPQVRLIASQSTINKGNQVTFQATATDNIKVAGLQLKVNNNPVILDSNGLATVTLNQLGIISAVAMATDSAGNIGQATTNIQVIDTTDTSAPVVNLDLSGITNSTISAPTDIKGTVTDTNLDYYFLEVSPVEGNQWQEIGRGTTNINNGILGKFDPSLLANDSYNLRLTAVDINGASSIIEETISVEGGLKLGNFTLSFTDLEIPVSGIPLTVTRTYDSLNSNSTDDFGYGWRLEFRDTDLRTSLGKDEVFTETGIRTVGFKDNTKVYITLPGGKRETFTFKPTPHRLSSFIRNPETGEGLLFTPAFTSEKGSTNTLSVKTVNITKSGNTYYGLDGQPFNPENPTFGSVYVLTTSEGVVYEIDAVKGDLLTVTDSNGNKLTYTDGGIFSNSGKSVLFGRDSLGRIVQITDPMGNVVKYGYDSLGDLISVTDSENNKTQLIYDNQKTHYLKEIIDPLGRSGAKMEYGDDNRLKKTINAVGNTVTIDYNPANSIQTVKDALNNPTTYEYDTRGNVIRVINPLGNQTTMKYDDNNNLTQTTDANGLITKYTYDSQNNLTSRTEAYCGCPTVTPGTTYYNYNTFGDITSLVLPTGASLKMEYDKRGNMLSLKDGKGNIIQSYTYYTNGLVKTETDTTGTTTYFYDNFGNVIKTLDADNSTTTMEYDANGKLLKMVEDKGTPNNTLDDETSTFTYDKLGREKRADYGNGIWVEYSYTGAGGDWTKLEAPTIGKIERKLTPDGKLAGWITPDGGTPTFKYDTLGRLWKETDASGNDITEYGYDAAGRLTTVKDLTTGATTTKKYDGGGRVIEEIDALKGFTKYTYNTQNGKLTKTERGKYLVNTTGEIVLDTNGKPIIDSNVLLQTYQYEYNGTSTTVIDPLGRKTTSVTDDYYLPTETIYPTGVKEKVNYLYANNLQEAKDYPTQIIDIGGNDRNFTYDSQGRLKTATDLGNGTYSYDYSNEGLAKITSPTGETLQYSYDGLGNLAKVTYGDGKSKQMSYRTTDNRLGTITLPSGETITYQYNSAGQITSQTASVGGTTSFTYTAEGAVKTQTDSTGTTTYNYESLTNRLSGINYSNGSSISYTYDVVGRVKTVTEKGTATGIAYTTEYDYDALGNLSWIKDPLGGITTQKYDVVNRLKERVLPNGVKTVYEYDELDRVKSIVHTNSVGNVLASVSYERKGIGEPSKITREDGSYVKLEYDESLRVKKESYYNGAGVLLDETSYSYDASGKRLVQSSTVSGNLYYSYTPGYQLDKVTETGEIENYDYDPNGRLTLIQRDGKTLDLNHDAYDRLTEVKNVTNGQTTQYQYDGSGHRVKAIEGNLERRFLVAPAAGSGLESTDLITDSNGNLISNYIYGGGSSPFMRLDGNGNGVYYLTDAMGTVIGLADGIGAEVGDFRYDSFGNLRSSTGVGAAVGAAGGDFRFQGQWLESGSGLYHFRARDYDAQTGLFTSRDPVDFVEMEPESFNPYQFVYNNPLIFSDPTGMITMSELNVGDVISNILSTIRSQATMQIKDSAINQVQSIATDILTQLIRTIVPFDFTPFIDNKGGEGIKLDELFRNTLCNVIGGSHNAFLNNLWLEVGIEQSSGNPVEQGYGCGPNPPYHPSPAPTLKTKAVSYPDFIFKSGEPVTTDKKPPAYVIGDLKFNINSFKPQSDNQFNSILSYAKLPGVGSSQYRQRGGHQYVPIALYVSVNSPSDKIENKMKEWALEKHGVILEIISFK